MSVALTPGEIDLLCGIFQRHPEISEVRLFGSRAKGTHSATSDIDLAVDGRLSALQAEALAAELDELPLPYRFDVVAWPTLPEGPLKEHIERVGHSVYLAGVPAK